jgi:hypothetical protein
VEWRYYGITLSGLKKTGVHCLQRYLDAIRRTIQDRRWTQQIPAIRTGVFERTTAFVFFAHVEDPDDLPADVPPPIQEIIQEIRYAGSVIRPSRNGGHSLDEIRSITRGNLETSSIGSLDSLFRDLAREEAAVPTLDLSASEEEFLDAPNPDLAQAHNHLLAYLSACGEGTWDRFARAAAELRLGTLDRPNRMRSLIRRLMLLGHLQTSADQQHWSVCPPTLVERESEPGVYFLCGSRTSALVADLERQLGAAERASHPLDDGPACLLFRATPEMVESVTLAGGLTLRRSGQFAGHLAVALPDYPAWIASLPTDGSLRMAAFPEAHRFDGTGFVPVACPHLDGERMVGEAGLYEFRPQEGFSLFRYLDDSGAWRTGDYHALRFAGTVAARGRTITKALDWGQTAVPLAQRWPLLHERCLVLADGRLPARIGDNNWIKYRGVSRALLAALQGKLPFDIEEGGDA